MKYHPRDLWAYVSLAGCRAAPQPQPRNRKHQDTPQLDTLLDTWREAITKLVDENDKKISRLEEEHRARLAALEKVIDTLIHRHPETVGNNTRRDTFS